jgi:hypothetical protein
MQSGEQITGKHRLHVSAASAFVRYDDHQQNDAATACAPRDDTVTDAALVQTHKCSNRRKCRTTFSYRQINELEKVCTVGAAQLNEPQDFQTCAYVSRQRRRRLAAKLHLDETQIKIWFQVNEPAFAATTTHVCAQNRRAKHRRMQAAAVKQGRMHAKLLTQ